MTPYVSRLRDNVTPPPPLFTGNHGPGYYRDITTECEPVYFRRYVTFPKIFYSVWN